MILYIEGGASCGRGRLLHDQQVHKVYVSECALQLFRVYHHSVNLAISTYFTIHSIIFQFFNDKLKGGLDHYKNY